MASKVELRSSRVVKQLVDHWRTNLSGLELLLLDLCSSGAIAPSTEDAFPVIQVLLS